MDQQWQKAAKALSKWRLADNALWKAQDRLAGKLEDLVGDAPAHVSTEPDALADYVLTSCGLNERERAKFLNENGNHFIEALEIMKSNYGW